MVRYLSKPWASRAVSLAASVAIWLITSATALAPPPVDAEMVERAIAGAELLAKYATENSEESPLRDSDAALLDWLLTAGGLADRRNERFASELAQVGYENSPLAVSLWLEEFRRVETAALAALYSDNARPIEEIEADINARPRVPLDDRDRAIRHQLMTEHALATVPVAERTAATAALGRLAILRDAAGLEALE